ncbi:SMP-30/gluconolactonase/LRE family protein [Mycolicibacterium sp. 050232]|uniref:SMP-30/gluconolactonase/LRE family protein n=1 Tax=Mycolicibacterium sp. 050232 TaxID=3113982 RepID=UPI002E2C8AFF|nr:SMP-30/gluconolactonase/LRE family protein [Mycolicibacterium sp. 050232]MED5811291.1 SMP-30/gluconolactonase/LRE family protein [Mycolicibacterium sp. 050232]
MLQKTIGATACAIAALFVTATPTAGATPDADGRSGACQRWQMTTVASGLGALENLEPDGRGGFYLSAINDGKLLHVDDRGTSTTVLSNLDHPAGLRLSADSLYFLTGNNPGTARGTLQRLDLATGQATTLLSGLPSPNGLLFLPDGDLIFSQLTVPPQGIGRYRPATGRHTKSWSTTPLPNGLALTPDRTALYTENSALSTVLRVPLDKPNATSTVARLPGVIAGSDDMQATRDGTLYVAGDTSGEVYAVNPATGRVCTIAKGLSQLALPPNGPTSVRVAPGPDGNALYVTAFDGKLRRLQPPAGIDLTPVT